MHCFQPIPGRSLLVSCRCVAKDTYDLTLWKNISIIQG